MTPAGPLSPRSPLGPAGPEGPVLPWGPGIPGPPGGPIIPAIPGGPLSPGLIKLRYSFNLINFFISRLRHGHTEGDVGKSVRPLAHFGPQN